MTDSNYKLMNQKDILQTIRKGIYAVNITTGTVNNVSGKELSFYQAEDGHLFVRLYHNGKRKAIAVHRLVWMCATKSTIPKDYEVHHIDGDPTNNTFENLMCVHKLDHRKFHRALLNDVPF